MKADGTSRFFFIRNRFYGSAEIGIKQLGEPGSLSVTVMNVLAPSGSRILQEDSIRSNEARFNPEELSRSTIQPKAKVTR